MEKIITVLITITPIIYQLSGIKGFEGKYMQYIPIIFLNSVLGVYIYKNKIRFDKEKLIIFTLLFFAVILLPFLTFNIDNTLYIHSFLYTGLYLNLIIFILFLSVYMVKEKYESTIKSFLLGNSVILVFNILININEFSLRNSINNIVYLFADNKTIVYFGFNHPNLVALYIVIEILLLYKSKQNEKKRKIYFNILIFIFFIFLLASGSRTGIISIVSFFTVNIFLKFWLKSKLTIKIVIVDLIGILICCISLFTTFRNANFAESINIRLFNIQSILLYLKSNNSLNIGIGPTSTTRLSAYTLGLGAPDNGYITIMVQYGVLGLSLILASIVYILVKNYRKKNIFNVSLIIMLLVYSLTESVLFVTGVLMTVLIWLISINFSYVDKYNNKEENCG